MQRDLFLPTYELYSPSLSPATQRVLATGGLAIALGIAGLCTLPFAFRAVVYDYAGQGNPVADPGPINTWGLISTASGCGLSALAILGGLGCLRLRAWGRRAMLIFAVASLLLGAAGVYFHAMMLNVARGPGGVPEFAMRVSALAEWVAWVLGTLFAIRVMYVMTRRDVIATMVASGE